MNTSDKVYAVLASIVLGMAIGFILCVLVLRYEMKRDIQQTGYYKLSSTSRICGVVQEKSYD